MKAMVPDDIQEGFQRFLDGTLTNTGLDDFTISSIIHHYQQARAREKKGNVHFFHYADLSQDLSGQISLLADIMKFDPTPGILDALMETNTFANMRKVVETSET